jgi:hypothetical protein
MARPAEGLYGEHRGWEALAIADFSDALTLWIAHNSTYGDMALDTHKLKGG